MKKFFSENFVERRLKLFEKYFDRCTILLLLQPLTAVKKQHE